MHRHAIAMSLNSTSVHVGDTENRPLTTGGTGFTGGLFRFIGILPLQCPIFHEVFVELLAHSVFLAPDLVKVD